MKTLLLVLSVFALGFNSGYNHQPTEEPDDGRDALIASLERNLELANQARAESNFSLLAVARQIKCQRDEFQSGLPILTRGQ